MISGKVVCSSHYELFAFHSHSVLPFFPQLQPQARSSRDTGKSPSSLGLADFDLLRVIGRGSYAKVLLVQLKKTERIYAMKVVKKELVNDDEVSHTEPDLPSEMLLVRLCRESTQIYWVLI